jgi:diguanylate cyclase (GGDEF)-like protein
VELPGSRKDGSTFLLELTVNEIQSNKRRVFVGIVRDITERKKTEERLAFMAQNDALTSLPNRSLFMDRLTNAILRANRYQSGLAVMFLDLDGFKQVNDTFGHHNGDILLKQFGTRLTQAVRKTDTVARLAGDEFTIILEGLMKTTADSQIIANKIIEAMQTPFLLGDQQVTVTTSIGIAIHVAGQFNPEELLSRADQAMYNAKHSGKNCCSIDAPQS